MEYLVPVILCFHYGYDCYRIWMKSPTLLVALYTGVLTQNTTILLIYQVDFGSVFILSSGLLLILSTYAKLGFTFYNTAVQIFEKEVA